MFQMFFLTLIWLLVLVLVVVPLVKLGLGVMIVVWIVVGLLVAIDRLPKMFS